MPLPAILKSLKGNKLATPDQESTVVDEKAVPADVGERRRGIAKIEALYRVFPPGSKALWALYASLVLYVYVYTLAGSTVYSFYAFAVSAFGEHAVLSTINIMTSVISGVGQSSVSSLCLTYQLWKGLCTDSLQY